jgi:tetratricopeptide (TPR) repeat protein
MDEIIAPEKLIKEGKSSYERGDYAAAAQAYQAAAQGFTTAGKVLEGAEAANNSSVAFLQAEDGEGALKAVENTPAIFAEAGDLRRQGMALGNLGAALEALYRLEEAADIYQQSADVLAQAGEDKLRANVMQSLSTLQLRMGRQLQALATLQAGIEGVKRPSPKQIILKQLLRVPFQMINKNKPG